MMLSGVMSLWIIPSEKDQISVVKSFFMYLSNPLKSSVINVLQEVECLLKGHDHLIHQNVFKIQNHHHESSKDGSTITPDVQSDIVLSKIIHISKKLNLTQKGLSKPYIRIH